MAGRPYTRTTRRPCSSTSFKSITARFTVVATRQVDHRTVNGGRNQTSRSPYGSRWSQPDKSITVRFTVVATRQVDHRTVYGGRNRLRRSTHVGRNKPSLSHASACGRSVRLHTGGFYFCCYFQHAKLHDRGLGYALDLQGTGVAQGTDHNDSDTGDPFGSSIPYAILVSVVTNTDGNLFVFVAAAKTRICAPTILTQDTYTRHAAQYASLNLSGL